MRQESNSSEGLDRHTNGDDITQLWRRRPDRIAINRDKRIIYNIEFKRTMDLRPSFQAKAEDRANKQHEWLTETLSRAVANEGWEVQMVVFTGGTMGSVKVDRFEQNRTTLEVKKKHGPRSGRCMPEHCWRPMIQFCEHTTKHYTQVTPR